METALTTLIGQGRIVTPRWLTVMITMIVLPLATYIFSLIFPGAVAPVLDDTTLSLLSAAIYFGLVGIAGRLAPTDPRLKDALEMLDQLVPINQENGE